MKDIIVTIVLIAIACVLVLLLLDKDTGTMGVTKDLFIKQIEVLGD